VRARQDGAVPHRIHAHLATTYMIMKMMVSISHHIYNSLLD
jgi:hypothetical protein